MGYLKNAILAGGVVLGVSIAGGLSAGFMSGMAQEPAKEMLPAVQFVGSQSKVTQKRFVLVSDEKAWEALWAEHTGVATSQLPPSRHAAPKIDFSRFIVVGYFGGATTNTDGEVVQGVLPNDDHVRVRFESATFQTASFSGPDHGVASAPYGLWVIEKTDKPIVVEQNRQGLLSGPPKWEVVKRFEK